eukprot:12142517-Heterocapsa_arctica.AAC.1
MRTAARRAAAIKTGTTVIDYNITLSYNDLHGLLAMIKCNICSYQCDNSLFVENKHICVV